MTQKELLYVEDAIGHEKSIISILNESIELLEDEALIKFLKGTLKKHESMQQKLVKVLEDKCND